LIIINIHKLFIGLIGSILLYLIINRFVVEVSVTQYIVIEVLITVSHWLYVQLENYMDDGDSEFRA
jgi:hypothetical protein